MKSVIVKNGQAVAYILEVMKSGDEVKFGYSTSTNELHADRPQSLVGTETGKISNAKKWQSTKVLSRLPIATRLNPGINGWDDQFLV